MKRLYPRRASAGGSGRAPTAFLDTGVRVALASDFKPGSSPGEPDWVNHVRLVVKRGRVAWGA